MHEHHVLTVELIEDRQTTRYSCPICQRCLEDGPEGFTVIHRGDPSARHRGGSISAVEHDVEQHTPGANTLPERRLLH